LLEIEPQQVIRTHELVPGWAQERLFAVPFVVVRRAVAAQQEIPIGVRGVQRNQRWSTSCDPKAVKRVLNPLRLLDRMILLRRTQVIPAFWALEELKERWGDLRHPWGPVGSIGFELATGISAATPESDLDIVIYADGRITVDEANAICNGTLDLPAVVDIRVENLVCGFSLREFARQDSSGVLLRLKRGSALGKDPWVEEFDFAGRSILS
jgi:phosphoribosyl-dephospho-CoA transferase